MLLEEPYTGFLFRCSPTPMIATLPDNLFGLRDAALLLVGFAGAFRRSELVSLNWGYL